MTGFEPRTSDIGSDRSTNWALQPLPLFFYFKLQFRYKWENFYEIGPLASNKASNF